MHTNRLSGRVVGAVGGRARDVGWAGDGGCRRVHPVRGLVGNAVEGERGVVVRAVCDRAAAEPDVRRDADAVRIRIARLDVVVERELGGLPAFRRGGRPRGAADVQVYFGRAGDLYRLAEGDGDGDAFPVYVGVAIVRRGRDGDALHAGRLGVGAAIDVVIGGDGAETPIRHVAGSVAQGSPGQRVRAGGNVDAVRVHIARTHGVGEIQRAGSRSRQGHAPVRGVADGQVQRRCAQHKQLGVVELDLHRDPLAGLVGVPRPGRGSERHLAHERGDGGHAMRGERAGAGEEDLRGIAGAVRDGRAVQRQRVGGNGDAVVVHFAGPHPVLETQLRPPVAAVRQRRGAVRGAHAQRQRRIAGDVHRLVEGDGDVDGVAGGVVAGRGGHGHAVHHHRRRVDVHAAIHHVYRIGRKPGETPVGHVAGQVGDGAVHKGERAPVRLGAGADVDAVVVAVVGARQIAEH